MLSLAIKRQYGLSILLFVYLFPAFLIHGLLKYTLVGRSIYAFGGDKVSTHRAGLNLGGIIFLVYALAGFAGLLHSSLTWLANPRDFIGFEIEVIAALVLGGAGIFGGKGLVLGTMLGVFLLVLVKNRLLIMKIPMTGQQFVIGFIILLATTIMAYRDRKNN